MITTGKVFHIKILGYVKSLYNHWVGYLCACTTYLISIYRDVLDLETQCLDLCIHLLIAVVHPKEINNRLLSSTNIY